MSLSIPSASANGATTTGQMPEPSGNFLFRVNIGDKNLGLFLECSGIGVEYEVLEHREGGNNAFVHRLRGRRLHRNLVLSRGMTVDETLMRWIHDVEDGLPPVLELTLLGQDAQPLRTFAFAAAIPVRWSGPSVTASSATAAMETLEVGHQGLVP